jgi:hypothetical protein
MPGGQAKDFSLHALRMRKVVLTMETPSIRM